MLFLRHLQGRRRRPGRMSQPSIVTNTKFHFFGGRKISCGFLHAFFLDGTGSPTDGTISTSKIATLPGEMTGAERS